ncbi:hypothetical protein MNV49_006423 [Pseudohyphozyma bogoriensis]|nr:hypothetical protein MNV49_006423 [Pseudohyphozyma bogoriensis]
MSTQWKPKRTLEECNAILTAPGAPWETQEMTINGRTNRVYSRLPPSMRAFWLSTRAFKDREYLVYQLERYTYSQIHSQTAAIASYLTSVGVEKGDRVVIVSRNFPEFVSAFWATHVLGAVAVAVNAWIPLEAMKHCIGNAEPKVCIADEERAAVLLPVVGEIVGKGCEEVLVWRAEKDVKEFKRFEKVVKEFEGAEYPDVDVQPDDNATIFFTSGTTSLPKGVLATQRQVLTNLLNTTCSAARAILRRGEDLPPPGPDPKKPQRATLLAVPLFHVTGNHSYLVMTTAAGGKVVMMRKWDLPEALLLLKKEKITTAGGVPFIAMELINSIAVSTEHVLDTFSFGGAPAPDRVTETLKANVGDGVLISQAYGSTETNAVAVGHAGEDYLARPSSTGLATPVNELKICALDGDHKELGVGETGEIWIKGPNVAEGYWRDPKASEAFKKDGWFQTLDEEGFLYISDRAKEIIIRGGENISTITVENALYSDPRVKDAAVVPVPDAKLGELVAAVVVLHPSSRDSVSEADLIASAAKTLPKHSVPVAVFIRPDELPRNATGKALKSVIKVEARELWEKRKNQAKAKL